TYIQRRACYMEFKIYQNDAIEMARNEMKEAGYTELTTPDEVNDVMKQDGMTLVFINSVCGCAGSIARPAATSSIQYDKRPDHLVTVFAGQDKEATAEARKYFGGNPPSSPSMALLKDGELIEMLHRQDIEGSTPISVIMKLQSLFDQHCEEI